MKGRSFEVRVPQMDFSSVRVANKVGSGFAIVILFLLIVSAAGYSGLEEAERDLSHYRTIARETNSISRIQALILQTRIDAKNFLLSGAEDEEVKTKESEKETIEVIKEMIAGLDDPAQLARMGEMETAIGGYASVFEKIAKLRKTEAASLDSQLGGSGAEADELLSLLVDSAAKGGDNVGAGLTGSVRHGLMLARLYRQKYLLATNDAFHWRFIGELAAASKGAGELAAHFPDGKRHELALQVQTKLQAYADANSTFYAVREERTHLVDALDNIGPGIARGISDFKQQIKAQQDELGPRALLSVQTSRAVMGVTAFITLFLGIAGAWIIGRGIANPIKAMTDAMGALAAGDHSVLIPALTNTDEVGDMARAVQVFKENAIQIDSLRREEAHQRRLDEGMVGLAEDMRGDHAPAALAGRVLAFMADRLEAMVAAFYLPDERGELVLAAHHAFSHRLPLSERITAGRGLLGQAVAAGKVQILRDVPPDYLPLGSGLGEAAAGEVLLVPFLYRGEVFGAAEFARFGHFEDHQVKFAERAAEPVAVTLGMAYSRVQTAALLSQSQTLSEELQAQQEELRIRNDEMIVMNEELEEKTQALNKQKEDLAGKNAELEAAGRDLEQKAEQLALGSRYKSEFLANMSHELRTPLNSLLILSHILTDNVDGNLNDDQIESLRIIHKGGEDLLILINDILDLSKIEAGMIVIEKASVELPVLLNDVARQLRPIAESKGLDFTVTIAPEAVRYIVSDGHRIEQIVKNLLSNALKFTSKGGIGVTLAPLPPGVFLPRGEAARGVAILVEDTGIGIPVERQREVWDAFQQADGSTSRKFGGTGLGLTISRHLARLLGGEILLTSEPDRGSTFTVVLPLDLPPDVETEAARAPARARAPLAGIPALPEPESLSVLNLLGDDRDAITPGDKAMLIIDDDPDFAGLVMRQVRSKGFRALVAATGGEGLALARYLLPSGIVLDRGLPDLDGEEVLRRLKADERTRAIPVHIASGRDKDPALLLMGAAAYLHKPVSVEDLARIFDSVAHFAPGQPRRVLVVEDDPATQTGLKKLFGKGDTIVDCVTTGAETQAILKDTRYDCLILDLKLPDMSGLELLQALQAREEDLPPIVVHTGQELTADEYKALREYSNRIVVKGAQSPERLMEEVSLFLHTVSAHMPLSRRQAAQKLEFPKDRLAGRKVMIVDDDVRNTFALAKVLRPHGLDIVLADDGQLALDNLAGDPEIDLVLMDIMMPVMDGYEAMRRIRADGRWPGLPIIAMTAKAMAEDKQKCLDAGANDYLPKPVGIEQLLALVQVWLTRGRD